MATSLPRTAASGTSASSSTAAAGAGAGRAHTPPGPNVIRVTFDSSKYPSGDADFESIASWQDLDRRIHREFKIPESKSNAIALTDSSHQPLDITTKSIKSCYGSHLFARLTDEQQAALSKAVHQPIRYEPHFSIFDDGDYPETERSGYNSVAFAIAEFIDNSLNAVNKNAAGEKKVIELSIIDDGGTNMLLILTDSGAGMSPATIESFARMSYRPEHRGVKRADDSSKRFINAEINRFGVGAKHAACHLGDGLVVISRQAHSPLVFEFVLSLPQMKEKHDSGKSVFEGEIVHRNPSDEKSSVLFDSDKKMRGVSEVLYKREATESHFTQIVITGIKEQHQKKLRKNEAAIVPDLASIYHYYLWGETGRKPDTPRPEGATDILVSYYAKGEKKYTHSLADVTTDRHSRYVAAAQSEFSFELVLNLSDGGTATKVAKVAGLLWYFPFQGGAETHPDIIERDEKARAANPPAEEDEDSDVEVIPAPPSASSSAAAAAAAVASPARGAVKRRRKSKIDEAPSTATAAAAALEPTAEGPAKKKSKKGDRKSMNDSKTANGTAAAAAAEEEPVSLSGASQVDFFEVFWNGRKIPLTTVRSLNFMKLPHGLKEQCGHRMKGALFFDHAFEPNRNKLKLDKVDLYDVLNNSVVTTGTRGHTLEKKFASWVGKAHAELDRNIVITQELKDEKGYSYKPPRFANLNYDGWMCKVSASASAAPQIVRVRDASNNARWVYGSVCYFLLPGESKSTSGYVVIKREPADTFEDAAGGDEKKSTKKQSGDKKFFKKDIRFLDRVTPQATIQADYDAFAASRMATVPEQMQVWFRFSRAKSAKRALTLADTKSPPAAADDVEMTKSDTPDSAQVVTAGYHIPEVQVKVWGHANLDGERVATLQTNVVWELLKHNPETDKYDHVSMESSDTHSGSKFDDSAWFKSYRLIQPGRYRLELSLNHYDMDITKHYTVMAGVPATLTLKPPESTEEGQDVMRWKLGQKNSSRVILLAKDQHDNVITPSNFSAEAAQEAFKLEMTSKHTKVDFKVVSDPKIDAYTVTSFRAEPIIDDDEKGNTKSRVLPFESSTSPLRETINVVFVESQLSASFDVDLLPAEPRSMRVFTSELGSAVTESKSKKAAAASNQLVTVRRPFERAEMLNGRTLPAFSVQLYDKYGHACGIGMTGPQSIELVAIPKTAAVMSAPPEPVSRAVDQTGLAKFEAQTLTLLPQAFVAAAGSTPAAAAAASSSAAAMEISDSQASTISAASAGGSGVVAHLQVIGKSSGGDAGDDEQAMSAVAAAAATQNGDVTASAKKKGKSKSKSKAKRAPMIHELKVTVYPELRPAGLITRPAPLPAAAADSDGDSKSAATTPLRLEGRCGTDVALELVFVDSFQREIPLASLLTPDPTIPEHLRGAAGVFDGKIALAGLVLPSPQSLEKKSASERKAAAANQIVLSKFPRHPKTGNAVITGTMPATVPNAGALHCTVSFTADASISPPLQLSAQFDAIVLAGEPVKWNVAFSPTAINEAVAAAAAAAAAANAAAAAAIAAPSGRTRKRNPAVAAAVATAAAAATNSAAAPELISGEPFGDRLRVWAEDATGNRCPIAAVVAFLGSSELRINVPSTLTKSADPADWSYDIADDYFTFPRARVTGAAGPYRLNVSDSDDKCAASGSSGTLGSGIPFKLAAGAPNHVRVSVNQLTGFKPTSEVTLESRCKLSLHCTLNDASGSLCDPDVTYEFEVVTSHPEATSLLFPDGSPLRRDLHRHGDGEGGVIEFKDAFFCATSAALETAPIVLTVNARPKTRHSRSTQSQHKMSDEPTIVRPATVTLNVKPTNRVTAIKPTFYGLTLPTTGGPLPLSAYSDATISRAAVSAAARSAPGNSDAAVAAAASSSAAAVAASPTARLAPAHRLHGYVQIKHQHVIEAGTFATLPVIAVRLETEDTPGRFAVPTPDIVAGLKLDVKWTPGSRLEERSDLAAAPSVLHPKLYYQSAIVKPEIVVVPRSSASPFGTPRDEKDQKSSSAAAATNSVEVGDAKSDSKSDSVSDAYVLFHPDVSALPMTAAGELTFEISHFERRAIANVLPPYEMHQKIDPTTFTITQSLQSANSSSGGGSGESDARPSVRFVGWQSATNGTITNHRPETTVLATEIELAFTDRFRNIIPLSHPLLDATLARLKSEFPVFVGRAQADVRSRVPLIINESKAAEKAVALARIAGSGYPGPVLQMDAGPTLNLERHSLVYRNIKIYAPPAGAAPIPTQWTDGYYELCFTHAPASGELAFGGDTHQFYFANELVVAEKRQNLESEKADLNRKLKAGKERLKELRSSTAEKDHRVQKLSDEVERTFRALREMEELNLPSGATFGQTIAYSERKLLEVDAVIAETTQLAVRPQQANGQYREFSRAEGYIGFGCDVALCDDAETAYIMSRQLSRLLSVVILTTRNCPAGQYFREDRKMRTMPYDQINRSSFPTTLPHENAYARGLSRSTVIPGNPVYAVSTLRRPDHLNEQEFERIVCNFVGSLILIDTAADGAAYRKLVVGCGVGVPTIYSRADHRVITATAIEEVVEAVPSPDELRRRFGMFAVIPTNLRTFREKLHARAQALQNAYTARQLEEQNAAGNSNANEAAQLEQRQTEMVSRLNNVVDELRNLDSTVSSAAAGTAASAATAADSSPAGRKKKRR